MPACRQSNVNLICLIQFSIAFSYGRPGSLDQDPDPSHSAQAQHLQNGHRAAPPGAPSPQGRTHRPAHRHSRKALPRHRQVQPAVQGPRLLGPLRTTVSGGLLRYQVSHAQNSP